MSKDTDKHLKSIAKSLEQVVHLLKGDRPGVLKEPAQVHIGNDTLLAIADAISEGIILEDEEEQE